MVAEARPLTLVEKIIAHNAIGLDSLDSVKPGNIVVLQVSWVMTSEAGWAGMNKTYNVLGRPKIHRKDRFWLAQDHAVDPRINHKGEAKRLIDLCTAAAKELEIIDFYPPNYTIMHTEFCRERAQPGQVVIGADSHTCSAGSLGALAIGLGSADVTVPLITGETWLTVPETLKITFINSPKFGIGGKDVILYILGELKRNTVADGKVVEYTGPGLKHLSCDARFAISNMTAEFGGIAGVFQADEITAEYIARRKSLLHQSEGVYFRADDGAVYANEYVIDLSQIPHLMALYPSPDNVTRVADVHDMRLDGVFIGSCTTTEEDLILASLILKAGLEKGYTPVNHGTRRVTPGSVPIVAKLRKLGLISVFEQAGFEIGAPGCSYCIGVAADVAGPGEVWLSSQNRNFKNRMGPGSIGNIASAVTVAASSFEMRVCDPAELLAAVDVQVFESYCQKKEMLQVVYGQPQIIPSSAMSNPLIDATKMNRNNQMQSSFRGKVQRFGDYVDTDMMISGPAVTLPGGDEVLGEHCFELVRPEFRGRVKLGFDIIVGGQAFGCGSSREEAPRAIKGSGIKAVIAKSFAFIYGRNQPSLALLGIVIKDEEFYTHAEEGAEVEIDVPRRVVRCGSFAYPFNLSPIEEALVGAGGIAEIYKLLGASMFRNLQKRAQKQGLQRSDKFPIENHCAPQVLSW